jgi:hypothetical protein
LTGQAQIIPGNLDLLILKATCLHRYEAKVWNRVVATASPLRLQPEEV